MTVLSPKQIWGGNPFREDYQPSKLEIIAFMDFLKSLYAAAQAGGGLAFGDLVGLNNDLNHDPNQIAWVMEDSTIANNGIYAKIGASGTGSWARLGDLPYSYISAINDGSGTANAIVATTSIPIPAADGAALIALPIVADTTASPVTASFNGSDALTVKTNSGTDIPVGGLVNGQIVAGYKVGSDFRLLSDIATSADRAAAEAAQAAAEDAQEAAETAQAAAETSEGNAKDWAATAAGLPPVATRAVLAALDESKFKAAMLYETIGRGGLFAPNVGNLAAAVAKDGLQGLLVPFGSDPTGASGAWERILDTTVTPLMWGADPTGTDDCTDALTQGLASGKDVYLPAGIFKHTTQLVVNRNNLRLGGPGFLKPAGAFDAVRVTNCLGAELDLSFMCQNQTGFAIRCDGNAERVRIRKQWVIDEGYGLLYVEQSNHVTVDWQYGIGLRGPVANEWYGDANKRSDILTFVNAVNAFATGVDGTSLLWDGNCNSLTTMNYQAVGGQVGMWIKNSSGGPGPGIARCGTFCVDYASYHGIIIETTTDTDFVQPYIQGAGSGSGLFVAASVPSDQVRVIGGKIENNHAYGIDAGTVGTSGRVFVDGTSLAGNGLGPTNGTVTSYAPRYQLIGGSYLTDSGSLASWDVDAGDYVGYDKASDRYLFTIAGNIVAYVDASGFHSGAPT